MLSAVIPGPNSKRVYAFQHESRASLPPHERLECPITGGEVTYVSRHTRMGNEVTAHFRVIGNHEWPSDVIPDNEYQASKSSGGESTDHMAGKLWVIRNASRIADGCQENNAQPEKRIYIKNKGKYRIADVAFVNESTGIIFVHEVQFSPISVDELEERTQDYFDAGVHDVQWYFGPKFKGSKCFDWHRERIGCIAIQLDVEECASQSL